MPTYWSDKMKETDGSYPIHFAVDYPEEPLNRLTTFFRLIWVIPINTLRTTIRHDNMIRVAQG